MRGFISIERLHENVKILQSKLFQGVLPDNLIW